MRRDAMLPPVFASLQGKVDYVQQVSDVEYSSSCPRCGGTPHTDGSYPDRFRLFAEGNGRGWCRKCGFFVWGDQADPNASPPTREEIERWRKDQIAREEQRRLSAERALALLRSEQIWVRYHQQLTAEARNYWRGRGIPDDWQNLWQLGWNPVYHVGPATTPSATIPLFDHDWSVLNVKHRLVRPPDPRSKYRYEITGQPHHPLFLANPNLPLQNHVVVIEGELKAGVAYIYAEMQTTPFVGLPSSTPSLQTVAALKDADRVTLIMDPGAEQSAVRLARALGPQRCRVVIPPEKIDDGILHADLSARDVQYMIRNGLKMSAFL